MKYALKLSVDGRIRYATFEKYAAGNMPLVEVLPEGDITDYIYQNGEYIYDPLPKPGNIIPVSADDVLNSLLGVSV